MKTWMVVGAVATGLAVLIGCAGSGTDDTQSGNGALSASAAPPTNPVACAGATATKPTKATLSCTLFVGEGDQIDMKMDANHFLGATLDGVTASVFSRVDGDDTNFSFFQVEVNPDAKNPQSVIKAKGSVADLQNSGQFDSTVIDFVPTSKEDEIAITCKAN